MSEEKSEVGKNVAEVAAGVLGFVVASVAYKIMQEVVYGNTPSLVPHLLFNCLIPCVLATLFGINKKRGVFGFLLGFFFSWLGVIVIGCFKTREEKSV